MAKTVVLVRPENVGDLTVSPDNALRKLPAAE